MLVTGLCQLTVCAETLTLPLKVTQARAAKGPHRRKPRRTVVVHLWGKKKANKHKEFWRDTPWCVSRLSRGHVPSVPWYVPSVPGTFCPLVLIYTEIRPKCPRCLGRPEFVPGTPPGHLTTKFLYVIFLYRFFLSIISGAVLSWTEGSHLFFFQKVSTVCILGAL